MRELTNLAIAVILSILIGNLLILALQHYGL
jgi:hypothetical protein